MSVRIGPCTTATLDAVVETATTALLAGSGRVATIASVPAGTPSAPQAARGVGVGPVDALLVRRVRYLAT